VSQLSYLSNIVVVRTSKQVYAYIQPTRTWADRNFYR